MPAERSVRTPAAVPAGAALPPSRVAEAPPTLAPRPGLVEILTELSARAFVGSLEVPGPRGGTIYLAEGLIAAIEPVAVPGVEELLSLDGCSPQDWLAAMLAGPDQARRLARAAVAQRPGIGPGLRADLLLRAVLLDAAGDLFNPAAAGGPFEDGHLADVSGLPPARPGPRHWLDRGQGVPLSAVLAEVARRRSLVSRLVPQLSPEHVLTRTAQPPPARLRLTADQWNLLIDVDGRTPRSLAWRHRRGLLTTTVETHRLVRWGLVAARPPTPTDFAPPAAVPEETR